MTSDDLEGSEGDYMCVCTGHYRNSQGQEEQLNTRLGRVSIACKFMLNRNINLADMCLPYTLYSPRSIEFRALCQ